MDDPQSVVRAFIADYFRWNREAMQRDEHLPRRGRAAEVARERSSELARQGYAALLGKYCRSGFEGESIAYGTDSLHDPASEVVSGTPRGDLCLARTRMTSLVVNVEMVTDFEYQLTRSEGWWYLESVKCVFEDGKYESL